MEFSEVLSTRKSSALIAKKNSLFSELFHAECSQGETFYHHSAMLINVLNVHCLQKVNSLKGIFIIIIVIVLRDDFERVWRREEGMCVYGRKKGKKFKVKTR